MHKKKVATIQMVHPYIGLNPNHLKITKIRRNAHMINEFKNLESVILTYLMTINFLSMCKHKAQSNLLREG